MISFSDTNIQQGRLRGTTVFPEGTALSIDSTGEMTPFGTFFYPVIPSVNSNIYSYAGCAQGDGSVVNHLMSPLRVRLKPNCVAIFKGVGIGPIVALPGLWRDWDGGGGPDFSTVVPAFIALEDSPSLAVERMLLVVQVCCPVIAAIAIPE